jgi:GntR family transcriptional regulator, transcriptional repressor for pyruvate dehydrogenase complex
LRPSLFHIAKQNRTFEDVVLQIEQRILEGSLEVGEQLPSERRLRTVFQVGRGTLREALRTLEQKGLITIKTGVKGGAFVSAIDTRQVGESLEFLLRHLKVSLQELAEFREHAEGIVTAMATKKATKEDLHQLQIFVESMGTYLDMGTWAEVRTEDIKFHIHLAKIAGNRIFESVLRTVYMNLDHYYTQYLPKNKRISQNTYDELRKIFLAIKGRKPKLARTLAEQHVKRSIQRMMVSEKHA